MPNEKRSSRRTSAVRTSQDRPVCSGIDPHRAVVVIGEDAQRLDSPIPFLVHFTLTPMGFTARKRKSGYRGSGQAQPIPGLLW